MIDANNTSSDVNKERYPLVSIVVLNYNGKHHLKTCLDSLLRTKYPNFEIILVDNGSTDGSVEFVRQNYPMVRIIRLSKNIYAAGGLMIGAIVAKGKYVAFLGNDIEANENWLMPLVEILEKMPWVAAADAKYMNFYERNRFDDAAAAGRWIDYLVNNYTRGVREIDYGQYDKLTYEFGVSTIFRRDTFFKVGGFDTSFLFGYEDIDLGWRLYLTGYKVVYVPQSIIYHKGGGSSREKMGAPRAKPEFYYLIKRNRLIMLVKNYEVRNMLIALFVTTIEYILTAMYFFLTRQNIYGVQIIRALIYILKNLRKIVRKRALVQSLRVRKDREIRRYMVPYSGDIWKFLRGIQR
jgi:GT2 family glycosyltransferase